MKNLLSFCLVFVLVGMFSSCKKDYTCTCTIAGQVSVSELNDAKKGDAEDACDALQTTAQLVDPAASCTLD